MSSTRRRTGRGVMFIVAAALLVLAACDGGNEAPAKDRPATPDPYPEEPNAEAIATGFVEAFGAFDVELAVGYLAPGAEIPEGLRAEQLPLLISFFQAQGLRQMLDPCEVTSTGASGTWVLCPYDFHAIRSDEIGLGPFHGSYWFITVRDGQVVRAVQEWEIEEFSPQMWEPFAEWVYTTYPRDFAVMYTGRHTNFRATNFRLTEESIRLWGRHSREYVEAVAR
ncbi:MAG TPA: hypothetical protein VJ913_05445 [Actinomycetota bacterium]|nr:hypothetical protein [Actinomycetota bacterium]